MEMVYLRVWDWVGFGVVGGASGGRDGDAGRGGGYPPAVGLSVAFSHHLWFNCYRRRCPCSSVPSFSLAPFLLLSPGESSLACGEAVRG